MTLKFYLPRCTACRHGWQPPYKITTNETETTFYYLSLEDKDATLLSVAASLPCPALQPQAHGLCPLVTQLLLMSLLCLCQIPLASLLSIKVMGLVPVHPHSNPEKPA